MEIKPNILTKENFVVNPNGIFETIKQRVIWDERMRARKTASFGISYDYSGINYPQTEMPDFLVNICQEIEKELGFYPNNCLLNYYFDGNSSMGFHSDSSEELAEGTGVAIVSLGAERIIVYRNKSNKNIEFSYILKNGSLLFMDNKIQEEWLHAIPKQNNIGERISLTFRLIVK